MMPEVSPQFMLIVKELSQGLDYELGPRGNLGDTCIEEYYNNKDRYITTGAKLKKYLSQQAQ